MRGDTIREPAIADLEEKKLSDTSDRPWLASYSPGVPADIDPSQYASLVQLMEESFQKYANRPAYSFMGKEISLRADRFASAARSPPTCRAWAWPRATASPS